MSIPVTIRPTLVDPMVVNLPATGYADTDAITVKIPSGRDYVIKSPRATRTGHLSIIGGRNGMMVGGHLTIGKQHDGNYPMQGARNYGDFNLEIKDGDAGSTFHAEGILIDASGGGQSDAFFINAPNRIVQLLKCRVEGLLGSLHNGRHADGVQTPDGCRLLTLDRCTVGSHYNTLYLRRENSPLKPPVQQFKARYSNTFGYSTNPAADATSPQYTLRGISLGTQPEDGDCNAHGACGPANDLSATNAELATEVWFDNFHIDPASAGREPLRWVFPDASTGTYAPAWPVLDATGGLYWPLWRSRGLVHGHVLVGPPRNGDYAKAKDVGLNYAAGIWA